MDSVHRETDSNTLDQWLVSQVKAKTPAEIRLFGEATLKTAVLCAVTLNVEKEKIVEVASQTWKHVRPQPDFLSAVYLSDLFLSSDKTRIEGHEEETMLHRVVDRVNDSPEPWEVRASVLLAGALTILGTAGATKESVLEVIEAQYDYAVMHETILSLSAEELLAIKRFAPSGHPCFMEGSPEAALFQSRREEKRLQITPELSKKIGWEQSQKTSELLARVGYNRFRKPGIGHVQRGER